MFRTGSIVLRRHCRTNMLTQIGIIMLFWLIGTAAAKATGISVPGSIIGLFLVVALLVTKQISVHSVRLGAKWFLGEMLLFFVPAVPVVLDHPELFGTLGLKIVAVILLSTAIVMAVTALFVDMVYRYLARRQG
ncbi:CidA/LrgA family protein [Seleniivibrio sp.]|uniref:CidA/LrgA family protein n=1 Tax=Seleniivibrio sp. TaxID=2898801 RepID=UPI0025FEED3B|nr:CidA/LrgA family protein [Seleniivibrio sp.]MCD8552657.1 CidA/LrgA family protein [Seleniivibrio sp.]